MLKMQVLINNIDVSLFMINNINISLFLINVNIFKKTDYNFLKK